MNGGRAHVGARLGRGAWPRADHLALAIVLACQFGLASWYARATPPWETPDEPWHMGYVMWLREARRLPPLTLAMLDTPLRQEASQAPLYYGLAAAATWPWTFGSADLGSAFVENPTRFKGVGLAPRQHNYALHGPWDDAQRPIVRGLRAARTVAALFALLAAYAAWRLLRQLRPERPWLAVAAAAWIAFTPQVLFLSGAASNDTAVAALATLALSAVIAFPRRASDGAAARLGAWYGLATLAKSSALALGPLVALAVVCGAWRGRSLRAAAPRVLRWGAIALAAAVATGGWWYIRNVVWYGTLIGRELHLAMPWAHRTPHGLARLAADDAFDLLFMSYWGVFGWGTIRFPRWVYDGMHLVVAAAAVGGLLALAGSRRAGDVGPGPSGGRDAGTPGRAWGHGLCAAWAVTSIGTLVLWMRLVEANWGRLLFPALGAITVLLVSGLDRLRPRGLWLAAALGGLVVWSAASPVVALRRAYGPPRFLTAAQVADLGDRVDWRMGDAVTLLSFTPLEPVAANPGFWPVRLCWQASDRPAFEPSAFVHVVGAADRIVASYDGTPGGGTWPGGSWRQGEAVCERIDVAIGEPGKRVPAPALYRVAVGMFDRVGGERMATVDRAGNPVVGNFVGQVKVSGPTTTTAQAAPVRFGADGVDVRLLEASAAPEACAGQPLTVTLALRVDGPPLEDLQVMVHVRRPGAPQPAAQGDGVIHQQGLPYPSSAWSAGEVLRDVRQVRLPSDIAAATYEIAVGLYRLSDLVRLPLTDGGVEVTERTAVVGRVAVRACP